MSIQTDVYASASMMFQHFTDTINLKPHWNHITAYIQSWKPMSHDIRMASRINKQEPFVHQVFTRAVELMRKFNTSEINAR